jgi:hypothetical protein
MIFNPGEKAIDLDKTYELAKWISNQETPHLMVVFSTVPFPGTKLWKDFVIGKNVNIKSIDWKASRYQFSNPKGSIAKKVFFKNGYTAKELDYYWNRMYSLEKIMEKRTQSLKGWKECDKEANRKNRILLEKMGARQRMKRRMNQLVNNPFFVFTRIFHLRVWGFVFRDLGNQIKNIFNHETK